MNTTDLRLIHGNMCMQMAKTDNKIENITCQREVMLQMGFNQFLQDTASRLYYPLLPDVASMRRSLSINCRHFDRLYRLISLSND